MEMKNNYSYFSSRNWTATSGVIEKYNITVTSIIISLIEEMKREDATLNYLLAINMYSENGKQIIKFSWEEYHGGTRIDHSRKFEFEKEGEYITDKFYAIDVGTYNTILFPSEY